MLFHVARVYVQYLCQISILTLERSRSKFKVKTAVLKIFQVVIGRPWFKTSSPNFWQSNRYWVKREVMLVWNMTVTKFKAAAGVCGLWPTLYVRFSCIQRKRWPHFTPAFCHVCCWQLLWHVDAFRRRFRKIDNHTCTDIIYGDHSGRCIFCALKVTEHSDWIDDRLQCCQGFETTMREITLPSIGVGDVWQVPPAKKNREKYFSGKLL